MEIQNQCQVIKPYIQLQIGRCPDFKNLKIDLKEACCWFLLERMVIKEPKIANQNKKVTFYNNNVT